MDRNSKENWKEVAIVMAQQWNGVVVTKKEKSFKEEGMINLLGQMLSIDQTNESWTDD